jgi:hypothetical protein
MAVKKLTHGGTKALVMALVVLLIVLVGALAIA